MKQIIKVGDKVSVPWVYIGERHGRKIGIVKAIKRNSCEVRIHFKGKYKGPLKGLHWIWKGKISEVRKIKEEKT